MRFLSVLFLLSLLTACGTESTAPATTEETMVEAPDRAGEVFGAEDDFSDPIAVSEIVAGLAEQDTLMDITVRGDVAAVCQMKGCWMTVPYAESEEMMVKFKDYGFFVPKDIDGREVVMHGKAYYEVVSVDELRHLAEDAGKPAEEIAAITEPEKELRFLASGVLLLPAEEE